MDMRNKYYPWGVKPVDKKPEDKTNEKAVEAIGGDMQIVNGGKEDGRTR